MYNNIHQKKKNCSGVYRLWNNFRLINRVKQISRNKSAPCVTSHKISRTFIILILYVSFSGRVNHYKNIIEFISLKFIVPELTWKNTHDPLSILSLNILSARGPWPWPNEITNNLLVIFIWKSYILFWCHSELGIILFYTNTARNNQ